MSASCSRREMLVGGVLLGTAAASPLMAWAAAPATRDAVDLQQVVPQAIGGWRHVPNSGLAIPQGEVPSEVIYDQLVSRHYEGTALPPIMLLIAFGQAQGGSTQLHRPELCYPAAGFHIAERPDVRLDAPGGSSFTARNLTGSAPGRTEQILYWTRVGEDFPISGLAQRWSVLRQTLTNGAPDGVLVRLSTLETDPVTGLARLRQFGNALARASTAPLRRLLWGSA